MNNRETDYDKLLTQNRKTRDRDIRKLRAVRDASNAIHTMAGRSSDNSTTDSAIETLQQSLAHDVVELEERARARSSQFTTTLVVAGVFVVLGLVLRSR